jgi:hypothetical protein
MDWTVEHDESAGAFHMMLLVRGHLIRPESDSFRCFVFRSDVTIVWACNGVSSSSSQRRSIA